MTVLSLHQFTCFLATYEHGSLTAAAEELGYAQPSVSEQVRSLEQTLGVQLFRRVGRGVVPTTVADTLRPHAERVLATVDEARQAVQQARSLETGTIRFGMFGTARLYAGAGLVADVLARHPGVRVELIGQNSTDVFEQLRRGRIEAAMIAVSSVTSEGMAVLPVARDELVYVSVHPERLTAPITPLRLSQAELVMPETTWRVRGLDPDRAAPDAARDRSQPPDPHRGRGRRDRDRARRHGAGRHGHEPRRRDPADPPAGSRGGHGLAASASSTTPSPSCTAPEPSSARRPG